MGNSAMPQFATEVSQQTITNHLWFWIVLALAALVCTYVGSWLAAYATRRGQTLATKADFNQLLMQAGETAREVEQIKSRISIGEWTEKEYKSLRRTKLEQVALAAHDVPDWLAGEFHRIVHKSTVTEEAPDQEASPIRVVYVMSCLYFPELRDHVNRLQNVHNSFIVWLRTWRGSLIDSAREHGNLETWPLSKVRSDAVSAVGQEYEGHFVSALRAVRELQDATDALMAQTVNPSNIRGE